MNGASVTMDTLRRTLAALSDAGWFVFEHQDSETPMLRITRRLTYDNIPRRYEHLVLQRIEQRAGERSDLPLSAVLSSEGTDWNRWWSQYAAAVLDEVEAAGLIRRLLPRRGEYVVVAAVGVLVWVVAARAGLVFSMVPFVALAGGALVGGVLTALLRTPIPTRAGRKAIRQAASGRLDESLIPEVRTAVPEVVRLPDDLAWSSYGGRWRTVTVSAAADAARRKTADAPAQVVGQVVKRWTVTRSTGTQSTLETTNFHYCCVDDGVSDIGWIFPVSERDHKQLDAGDLITMEFGTSRLRFGAA